MKSLKFLINILFVIIWIVLSFYVNYISFKLSIFLYGILFYSIPYEYFLTKDLAESIFRIWIPNLASLSFFFGGTIFFSKYLWFSNSRSKKHNNSAEIKKYAELRDKGIITENEFQDKKKKLLDL